MMLFLVLFESLLGTSSHILAQHFENCRCARQVATSKRARWLNPLIEHASGLCFVRSGRSSEVGDSCPTIAWTIKLRLIRISVCKAQPLWGSARSHSASRTHKLHLCFPPGLNWKRMSLLCNDTQTFILAFISTTRIEDLKQPSTCHM